MENVIQPEIDTEMSTLIVDDMDDDPEDMDGDDDDDDDDC
jgi:hypothetical protein